MGHYKTCSIKTSAFDMDDFCQLLSIIVSAFIWGLETWETIVLKYETWYEHTSTFRYGCFARYTCYIKHDLKNAHVINMIIMHDIMGILCRLRKYVCRRLKHESTRWWFRLAFRISDLTNNQRRRCGAWPLKPNFLRYVREKRLLMKILSDEISL